MTTLGRPRRRPAGAPSAAVKAAAYKAWGWHLRHAHELERLAGGAGDAYLKEITAVLERARRDELSRLSRPSEKAS